MLINMNCLEDWGIPNPPQILDKLSFNISSRKSAKDEGIRNRHRKGGDDDDDKNRNHTDDNQTPSLDNRLSQSNGALDTYLPFLIITL